MRKREFDRLIKKIDNAQRSIKLTEHIMKEKSDHPKYPDLFSLETYVKDKEIECKLDYNCGACPTKKRNVCWKEAKKVDNKKVLLSGMPYPRVILGEMRISNLWIIASHLGANLTSRSKSSMVDAIMKKQYKQTDSKKVKEVQ